MSTFGRPLAVLIGVVAAIVPVAAVGAAPVASGGAAPAASVGAAPAASSVLYNSTVTLTRVGNLPSVGFEADSVAEFGNQITLTRAAKAGTVVVTLSSWGCQSGTWPGDNCVTAAGAKFTEPITLNIYHAPTVTTGPTVVPGARILSVTKTFSIPYRPSANTTKCTGTSAGQWYDKALGSCFNGLATNITFNLTSLNLSLPKSLVFGIAYNTSDYGYAPYGDSTACHSTTEGCPYDSLNIALSQDPTNVSRGTDPNPGTVFQYSSSAGEYCDNGAGGTSIFRLDSPGHPCWGVSTPDEAPWYIPAVEFTAI